MVREGIDRAVVAARRAPLGLWLASVGITVFLIRVLASEWQGGFAPFFPDSSSFDAVASRGPFWPRFWFDERPVGFPLLYWVVGRSPRMVVLVQATAYAVACCVLCATLVRIVWSRVIAAVGCLIVVALCVQPRFSLWTTHVLSESLGLTTAILSFAAWLWFAAAPDRRRLWWAVAASLAWVLTRDSNMVPFALVVVPSLAIGARWWRSADPRLRRAMAQAAVLGTVVCIYVFVSQDVSERNRYPVLNNIGQRVLVDPDMTQWFVDGGMPLDDAVVGRTGRSSFDDDFAMLNDPALDHLRTWAEGPGQRRQVLSFVLRADFWIDHLRADLPQLLGNDLDGYDLFGVSDRLPARLAWLDGPRTPIQLVVWTLLAGAGAAVAARHRQRRLLALVVALALASSWLDLYLAYAGDSVEVQRHLVGPVLRLTLALVVASVIGIDSLASRRAPERSPTRRITRRDIAGSALLSVATAAVLAAWFGNEMRSQDYDPQFARTIVERAGVLGGTYYQNGIHNKGPFEMVVYDASRWFTSWGSYWYGISTFVLVVSGVVAVAGWVTARRLNATSMVAAAAAGGIAVHLTLSTSDYAGVLYSRNLTSAMLAVVWTLVLLEAPWRDERTRRWSLLVCGALLGLAIQTLLTTVFAAAVIGCFVVVRRGGDDLGRSVGRVVGAAVATICAAPVWYVLRGSGEEFWAGWWTYAHFMSSGTGRSLGNQLGLGWTQLLGYHRDRPGVVLVVVGFCVATWALWPRLARWQKQVHATLIAWLAAAWIELVLSQRYSSHYFSVIAVPLVLMATVLLARVTSMVVRPGSEPSGAARWRSSALAPLTVVCAVLLVQCATPFWTGLTAAGEFSGFADHTRDREQARGGPDRSTRAILDLVSGEEDPLLAWTMYPWTYLDQHRIPATRLSWKSFMLGEIYLGRTGPEYVLPQTWQWFAQDMAQTNPAALVTVTGTPLAPGTPFATYATQNFQLVYPGEAVQVQLRTDLLAGVTGPVTDGSTWTSPTTPPSGWDVAPGAVVSAPPVNGPLVLDTDGCMRLGADLSLGGTGAPSEFIIRLVDRDGSFERVSLGFDGLRAWSASDTVQFESVQVSPTIDDAPHAIVVVVGARSAALVIDGVIGAAARLDGAVEVQLEASGSVLALDSMVVGAAPAASGC